MEVGFRPLGGRVLYRRSSLPRLYVGTKVEEDGTLYLYLHNEVILTWLYQVHGLDRSLRI